MVWSEIKERGETWQSCNTHYSLAFTSGEKLEYATKSNIECNSGISKDIWCHKSMYYYIWIYKYVFLFCSFTLHFYCSLWWSDCLQEMLCRIQKIFLFLLDKLLANIRVISCLHNLYMHVCKIWVENVYITHTIRHLHSQWASEHRIPSKKRKQTKTNTRFKAEDVMCSFQQIPKSKNSQLMCTYCGWTQHVDNPDRSFFFH